MSSPQSTVSGPPARPVTSVSIESPDQADVIDLLNLGTTFARSLYPPENTFLLSVAELDQPGVDVYVARDDDRRATGMAALVPWGVGVTELKRMFVRPEARGRGIASQLLLRMESDAQAQSIRQIVLETGTKHAAAVALYRAHGFVEIPQFGTYIGEPYSVCMAKMLRR